MPHAHPATLSNFEAIKLGLGLGYTEIYFIVNKDFVSSFRIENNFKNSKFCGLKESCLRHLIVYPDCKII